jgi:hypothetical protein
MTTLRYSLSNLCACQTRRRTLETHVLVRLPPPTHRLQARSKGAKEKSGERISVYWPDVYTYKGTSRGGPFHQARELFIHAPICPRQRFSSLSNISFPDHGAVMWEASPDQCTVRNSTRSQPAPAMAKATPSSQRKGVHQQPTGAKIHL